MPVLSVRNDTLAVLSTSKCGAYQMLLKSCSRAGTKWQHGRTLSWAARCRQLLADCGSEVDAPAQRHALTLARQARRQAQRGAGSRLAGGRCRGLLDGFLSRRRNGGRGWRRPAVAAIKRSLTSLLALDTSPRSRACSDGALSRGVLLAHGCHVNQVAYWSIA